MIRCRSCESGDFRVSVLSPIASSLSGSRRWNVSSPANRCVAFMNACLEYWRSKVNRLIPDCEDG